MISHQEFKDLLQNIVASYEARLQIVKNIIDNAEKTLGKFRAKREEMSTRLREALAKSVNLRKTDFDKMMGEILEVQAGREGNIKKILTDFRQEEEDVLVKLKSLLDQGEKVKIKDFKKMLSRIKNGQKGREKATSEKVGAEIERMRNQISEMLTTFKKERDKRPLEWPSTLIK